ncbi:MAG: DUF4367 domain-containing protein [Chloroflexota bacterium]|nr:MAG: DUF4367 domain-containing protein [Chloroflexota bacterium]
MNNRRNLLLVVGAVVLIAVLVSGFVLMQPTAEDILVQTLETMETIDNAHGVVEINVDTVDKDEWATIEFWGRRGEDSPGAFRLVVLESSNEKFIEGTVVSDGENLWAYSPSEKKVYFGTIEEAKQIMADKRAEMEQFDKGEFDHPENAREAVDLLQEYFEIALSNTEFVADTAAQLLILNPIPEQMPAEYAAVGGQVNLWIDEVRNLPLAVELNGSSLGKGRITVKDLVINSDLDDGLFIFEPQEGVDIVALADLEPKSTTLADATASAEFELLTPSETPDGATLVDVLEVKGAIVQRFTLPDGGSFSIAQGLTEGTAKPSEESQTVEVRGVTGSLFVAEDGSKVSLTWIDGDLFYMVGGDITSDQALMIAESLQ